VVRAILSRCRLKEGINGEEVPFNFLLDAEDFWIENDPGSELKSGLWSEIDRSATNAILKPQQFV